MKHALFLLLILSSTRTLAGIWDPHEKVIMSILRRAERTPEARLNRKYSNIEQFRVDRAYYEANAECGEDQTHRFAGITKYTTRHLDYADCYLY